MERLLLSQETGMSVEISRRQTLRGFMAAGLGLNAAGLR